LGLLDDIILGTVGLVVLSQTFRAFLLNRETTATANVQ